METDIEQPLTGRNLITSTDLLPKQAQDVVLHLVEPFNQVLDRALHGHAHPMSPCEPLENPTVGGSFCWLVALVRQRLVVGCPLGASSTWRHRRAQKRAGPHHPEPLGSGTVFSPTRTRQKTMGLGETATHPPLGPALWRRGGLPGRSMGWRRWACRAHSTRSVACATLCGAWSGHAGACLGPPRALRGRLGGGRPLPASVCVQSPRRSRPEAIALVALARPGPGAQPWASHSVELARETVAARAPPLHAAALCGGALRRAPWRPATSRPARAGPCRRDTTRAPESGSGPRGRATGPTGARGMSTCATRWRVPGRRVLQPHVARGVAVAAVYRVAAATRDRGVGAWAQAGITAWARSCNIGVADAWPSQRVLTQGTPPSGDTLHANTACFQAGRGSVAAPGGMVMAGASRSGTESPRRAKLVVSRGWQRWARPSWTHTAHASALNHRSQPDAWTASSVRPSVQRWHLSAWTPSCHSRSSGL